MNRRLAYALSGPLRRPSAWIVEARVDPAALAARVFPVALAAHRAAQPGYVGELIAESCASAVDG